MTQYHCYGTNLNLYTIFRCYERDESVSYFRRSSVFRDKDSCRTSDPVLVSPYDLKMDLPLLWFASFEVYICTIRIFDCANP